MYRLPFTSVALPPLPDHAPDAPSTHPRPIPSSSRALPPFRDNRYPARSLPSFDENFGTPDSDVNSATNSNQQEVALDPQGDRRRAASPSPESYVASRYSRDPAPSNVSSRARSIRPGSNSNGSFGDQYHYTPFHNDSWSTDEDRIYLRDETPALLPDEGDDSDCSDHFDDPPQVRRNGSLRSSTYRHDRRRRAPYDARDPSRYAMSPAMSQAFSPVLAGQTPWSPFIPAFQQMSLSQSSPVRPMMYGPVAHPDPNLPREMAYVAYYTMPRSGPHTGMPIPRASRRRPSMSGYQRSVSARESQLASRYPEEVRVKPERAHRGSRARAATLARGSSHTERREPDHGQGSRSAHSLPEDTFMDQSFGDGDHPSQAKNSPSPVTQQQEPAAATHSRPAAVKTEAPVYCPAYVWYAQAKADIVRKYKHNKEAQEGTEWARPPGSYADLIGRAILESAPPHQLDVCAAFKAIVSKWPLLTLEPRLLYNGIRHGIANNAAFTRVQKPHGDPNSQARQWRVTPGYEYYFDNVAERQKTVAQPRRTASTSSSIGPFEMEMDDSPEIPLRSLYESEDRKRAITPEASIRNTDVDRTPMGPTADRTPVARSAERPPRLDMEAIRSHSIMSGFSTFTSTQGEYTPALSFDGGSSARPSPFSLDYLPPMSIPQEAVRPRSREPSEPDSCLGFPISSFRTTSEYLNQQSSRVPLASKTNHQNAQPALGFSPFANTKSQGVDYYREYNQSPDIISPLPQALNGAYKPVPIRSLSALSSNRSGSATTSVSGNTVSSLASAMDVSLVRSRNT